MASTGRRYKLSTTIAPETQAYLEQAVREGRSRSMAEAVDQTVARWRSIESRAHLEAETAAYFATLPADAAAEENQIASGLGLAADAVDYDP